MRPLHVISPLALSLALTVPTVATAEDLPWQPSSIYSMTKPMNCDSWNLAGTRSGAALSGALPGWLIFNAGPADVVIRGGGTRTRAIPPFDGRLVTFPGEPRTDYVISLAAPGSAVVHVCQM